MTKGFLPFRVGHAAGLSHNNKMVKAKRADDPCSASSFYISPSSGQSVNSSLPFTMTWNPVCITSQLVDIYLYAPKSNESRIQIWQNVDFSAGSLQTDLKPKWWNSTSSIDLQLSFTPSGSPPFLSPLSSGPVFTATYTPSASGSADPNADTTKPDTGIVTKVDNFFKNHHITGGRLAAAVLVPLIFVGLAVFGYIRYQRRKAAKKTQRFSQALDKRMSVVANDWRSMSTAGAEAAIRHSMAISNYRASAAMSQYGRPASSTYAVEAGQAGIGAGATGDDGSQMSQIRRPGVGPRGLTPSMATSDRVSRVSFAADTRFSRAGTETSSRGRPSLESRRAGAATRSFHTSIVPPLPTRQDSAESSDATMSPTQTHGPLELTTEDIHARMSGIDASRPSLDDVLPALSLMRTGGIGIHSNTSTGDLILTPKSPASPTPDNAYTQTLTVPVPASPAPAVQKSPIIDAMPMQDPNHHMYMSPDEMMRAYAERRQMGTPTSPAFPSPVAGNGMRTLFSPPASTMSMSFSSVGGPAPSSVAPSMSSGTRMSVMTVGSNNPFRKSMATEMMRQSSEEEEIGRAA